MQGYFGGWTDLLFQRVIEVWSALPSLYVLIIIASFIVPSLTSLLFVLLLFNWVSLVGVVRAEFLAPRAISNMCGRRRCALGLNDRQTHLAHTMLPPHGHAVATPDPAALHHERLGDGADRARLPRARAGAPARASLGELLQEGQSHREAWWLALSGFFSTGLLLVLLVFIGEGIRDAFDPRKTLV